MSLDNKKIDDLAAGTAAVILAAGLGKRMGASIPKVLAELAGRPLIQWVVEAAHRAGIGRVIVVIGHKGEMVEAALKGHDVEFVWQRDLLGTGHAVMQALPLLKGHEGLILVLLGDAPRVRPETIRQILSLHVETGASATVLSADFDDPHGYGRVIRRPNGLVEAIVEERDADDKTKSIKEINSGCICFSPDDLFSALDEVTNENAQGEYYLTEVPTILRREGKSVAAHKAEDPIEAAGVNSPDQLDSLKVNK